MTESPFFRSQLSKSMDTKNFSRLEAKSLKGAEMKRKVAKSLPCSFFDLSGSQLAESFDWPNAIRPIVFRPNVIRPIVKASEGFALEIINFHQEFLVEGHISKIKS